MAYLLHLFEAIVAVNILVVIHEIGHLVTARMFGVPSLRFSIGLGPPVVTVLFRGVRCGIGPFPIGGYVQLASDHAHEEGSRCMGCLTPWQRALVYLAGPGANLLFVILLLWMVYGTYGYRYRAPVVGAVVPGGQAAALGIEPGDRILRVNGKPVGSWGQVMLAVRRGAREDVRFLLERGKGHRWGPPEAGRTEEGDLFLVSIHADEHIGVLPTDKSVHVRLGAIPALEKSVRTLWQISGLLCDSLLGLLTARTPPSELVGPVYLFHLSSKAASQSPVLLLYLLAFISASLCFFNLLPIPLLDGGQILLSLIEKALKRPLGTRSLRLLTHASVFWLLLILASATLNDIVRLLAS